MDPMFLLVIMGAGAAGFVQGLSGFAFGLPAMAFWAWSVPRQLAGPLVVFGSLVGQTMSIGTVRHGFDLRRTLPFLAGGVIGVPAGGRTAARCRRPTAGRRRGWEKDEQRAVLQSFNLTMHGLPSTMISSQGSCFCP